MPCSNWRLLIELQFSESDLPCPDLSASHIAQAANILQSQNISVAICLTSEHGKQYPPEQHVLQLLAPYLQGNDLYSITPLGPRPSSTSCFSETHLKALSSAQSRLEKLSFSDHACDTPHTPLYNLTPIAAFSKLQKLHLTTCGIIDFRPLATLKCLQDLAIQHVAPAAAVMLNRSDVIDSNRQSLRCVTLVAHKWGPNTYRALGSVENLHTLVVKVNVFGWLAFSVSPWLTALASLEFVIVFPGWPDFVALSSMLSMGSWITSLVLCPLHSKDVCWLTLLRLKQLCIINSNLT